MKKSSNTFSILTLAFLFILISCGGKDEDEPKLTNAELNAKILAETSWKPSGPSNITYGQQQEGDWSNFILSFIDVQETSGKYEAKGVPDGYEVVWPATGSWEFVDAEGASIERSNDDAVLGITVESELLTLSFTLKKSSSKRITGIYDKIWSFTLVPQSN